MLAHATKPPTLDAPSELTESDLAGTSLDVSTFKSYCHFCRERGIKPASWEFMFQLRMQELTDADPKGPAEGKGYGPTLIEEADAE